MNAKQLRNSLLQEAIQGRLVSQDPNDEPASVLLRRIRKEKEQLVKDGKLKKKDLEIKPITEDEKPFEIPKSWEWCILGDVFAHNNGKQLNKGVSQGTMMDYITTSNLYWDHFVLDNLKQMPFEDKEIERCQAIKGDLLVCEGGDIGRSAIWNYDFPIMLQNHIHKLRAFSPVCTKYFYYVLFLYNMTGKIGGKGIGIQGFSSSAVHNTAIPLPPLAEQRRIVEKLEQLLPLVERYDKAQTELNRLNEALPEQLKKSILQEAIQGRLVPQNADDEPASVLLKKIRKEKETLVKQGKLKKKDLEVKPITEDEIPFEIPKSWEWCRLGEIGIFERGNGIKREETFDFGKPCVRYGEMYTKYRYSPTFSTTFSYTSDAVFSKCRKAQKGDLFMALTGENKEDIALAAQYVGEDEVAVGGDLCHFTIFHAYARYFVYLINSKYFRDIKRNLATGDIIVHISADKLGSIPIPLPPLAEQRRIVAKVEALFAAVER